MPSETPNEVTAAPAPVEKALTDLQVGKVVAAHARAQAAGAEARRAQRDAQLAEESLNDLVAVIFDAAGVPATSQLDLQRGVIVVAPAAE